MPVKQEKSEEYIKMATSLQKTLQAVAMSHSTSTVCCVFQQHSSF